MEQKIILSPKKILAKQFQVDYKGYNPLEVDHFLDTVSKDYQSFAYLLNDAYQKIEELENKIEEQKKELFELNRAKSLQDDSVKSMEENLNSNVDILKRLSMLEKVVYEQLKK